MGYQFIENLKNARELILREYEDTDAARLPDERYQLRLQYYDNAQLIEERKAYDVQAKSFETEVAHLWDVLEMMYEDSKFLKRITDFDDLAGIYRRKIRTKIKSKTGEPVYEDIAKVWDEISFVKPAETEVEKMNRTYLFEKDKVKSRLILMRDKLKSMYSYQYPIQRRVVEERLTFLQKDFDRFDYIINPYHIQPGLLLDVDICSIKRKKATLDGMANVLNEFLHGVSKGFQDAAFASFSRRRSTVREDIAQSFSPGEGMPDEGSGPGADYLAMLNTSDAAIAESVAPSPVSVKAPGKRGPKPKGVVDSGRKAGRPAGRPSAKPAAKPAGKRGRPSKNEDGGLRQL
jgi:hypothetical protein